MTYGKKEIFVQMKLQEHFKCKIMLTDEKKALVKKKEIFVQMKLPEHFKCKIMLTNEKKALWHSLLLSGCNHFHKKVP